MIKKETGSKPKPKSNLKPGTQAEIRSKANQMKSGPGAKLTKKAAPKSSLSKYESKSGYANSTKVKARIDTITKMKKRAGK